MSITSEAVLNLESQPLMVLKKYQLSESLPLEIARQELGRIILTEGDKSATWGYFPELNDTEHDYQASKNLAQSIGRLLTADAQTNSYPLDLAFVRLATHEPQSDYGGFHVDVSPGIAHAWARDVPKQANILRILFNVYEKPRRLEFYPFTAEALRKQGFDIPTDHYKILEFPEEIQPRSIEIPPLQDDAVYSLQFLSNLIPHAGRTNADGHFLVSYGGYIDGSASPFEQ